MGSEVKVPERSEMEDRYTWDLQKLYSDEKEWKRDLENVKRDIERIRTYEGRSTSSNGVLAELLHLTDETSRKLERAYTWAHLKHDEDLRVSKYQSMYERASRTAIELGTVSSYIVPEILSLPEERLEQILEDQVLAFARVPLREIIRKREHFLDRKEEKLLAMVEDALGAPARSYQSKRCRYDLPRDQGRERT